MFLFMRDTRRLLFSAVFKNQPFYPRFKTTRSFKNCDFNYLNLDLTNNLSLLKLTKHVDPLTEANLFINNCISTRSLLWIEMLLCIQVCIIILLKKTEISDFIVNSNTDWNNHTGESEYLTFSARTKGGFFTLLS